MRQGELSTFRTEASTASFDARLVDTLSNGLMGRRNSTHLTRKNAVALQVNGDQRADLFQETTLSLTFNFNLKSSQRVKRDPIGTRSSRSPSAFFARQFSIISVFSLSSPTGSCWWNNLYVQPLLRWWW